MESLYSYPFFEGLTAGKTYDVTFELDGFESKTVQITIKDGGQGATNDFVTVQHVELTSTSPAKVDVGIELTKARVIVLSTGEVLTK